ncbi:LacI family DNA-binding transcriptional regulator [Celeribacter marinus]|uniref:Transcriptional regulator, LacI family n=1 Tax=Celeribacter marinus TaxID=1397108 RepID=A0A0P0A886_9RHOB|nr:LacI family DNA-binding transcriptional regulator [Celeribacter marinus]ALI54142.1 transcriptional regulator, LacI family [Celeribacter marinus]SFL01827.1 transcriptional regulator, LacI family [Celeribacter marinus]
MKSSDLPLNITADDVATAAGVSRWTVNRAFKKDASISSKSREKVMAAAEALGYVPDLRAVALASDRSNLVALLIDDFANPHKLVMLERLTRALRSRGWDTMLVNTLNRNDAAPALLNASRRRVDATILIGIQFDDEVLDAAYKARHFKKLIIFARSSENEDTISISVDDRAATIEIAEYVRDRGYRKPFYLAGPRTDSAHLSRKETFVDFWMQTFGETCDSVPVPAYDPILAADIVAEAFGGKTRAELPDIIVCENDALALGTIDAIRHRLGLKVPEDIAVIGFDDVPQGESPNYRLTTYRQPLTDMANYLVDVLESSQTTQLDKTFIGRMVVRESA